MDFMVFWFFFGGKYSQIKDPRGGGCNHVELQFGPCNLHFWYISKECDNVNEIK